MEYIDNILFLLITLAAGGYFAFQLRKIYQNVKLGKALDRNDEKPTRVQRMLLVAFGQQKMFKRPLPAVLHAFVYVGFLIINIEVLEIVIDGIFGTHRVLFLHENPIAGGIYSAVMSVNEILGLLVIIACVIFLFRRNVIDVPRFHGPEMTRFPKLDGNIILFTEIILMGFLFAFNIGDIKAGTSHGVFLPISGPMAALLPGSAATWKIIATVGWWGHIVGIFLFLNYLPISKHFHIMAAFPNVYTSKLEPAGQLNAPENITTEIKAIMDPSFQPPEGDPGRLGARDVTDLAWTNLLDAYTCTECGRCTDNCPANITGKKLSPRKIVMDTRDRLEELKRANLTTPEAVNEYAEKNQKYLLGEYITPEELWACTTCNACTEACPVNIDHVTEIVELRRYLVLEESSAPQELNIMFNNIENNGAPWPMPASARFDWAGDITVPA